MSQLRIEVPSRRITDTNKFIVKITLTNYANEDIQIARTPDSCLYDRADFTKVDSDDQLPGGLADSLEWIDSGRGKPDFQGEVFNHDKIDWDIDTFVNPMNNVAEGESTRNRIRRGDSGSVRDGQDEEEGSESKHEAETEQELEGYIRDDAERERRLFTLRKKGLKFNGSSSKTFKYDGMYIEGMHNICLRINAAGDAYMFWSNTGTYRFRLRPQNFWYRRDGGEFQTTEVILEKEFEVRIALDFD